MFLSNYKFILKKFFQEESHFLLICFFFFLILPLTIYIKLTSPLDLSHVPINRCSKLNLCNFVCVVMVVVYHFYSALSLSVCSDRVKQEKKMQLEVLKKDKHSFLHSIYNKALCVWFTHSDFKFRTLWSTELAERCFCFVWGKLSWVAQNYFWFLINLSILSMISSHHHISIT